MPCAELLRVHAYFDDEVDAIRAGDIERHIAQCPECSALIQDLDKVRTGLRRDLTDATAPPELRARITSVLDRESGAASPHSGSERTRRRLRPFWQGAFSGIAGTAIAAGLAFLILAPPLSNPLLDELASAHARSLMPEHLIDVASTDKHTVKPWFAGHADVSPVVADFPEQGYRLIGGRADYFDHQRAAVIVYQHGPHIINVFSWTARHGALPKDTTRNGYHLAFWRTGDLEYCAVSDTAWDELLGLSRLLQDLGAHDARS